MFKHSRTEKNEEKNRFEKSAWLLEPARTSENIITYVLVFIMVIAITLILT